MKKRTWFGRKKITAVFTALLILLTALPFAFTQDVYADDSAASLNVSVTSTEVTAGMECNVSVNAVLGEAGSLTLGSYTLYISYNTEVLEYVSGGDTVSDGVITLTYNAGTDAVTEYSQNITFKGLTVGSSEISVNAETSISYDSEGNTMSINTDVANVKVVAADSASYDNSLQNLEVYGVTKDGTTTRLVLDPAFSNDVNEYDFSVSSETVKLLVIANTTSEEATVSISSLELDYGDNSFEIIVTAESGDTAAFYLYCTRKESESESETGTDSLSVSALSPEEEIMSEAEIVEEERQESIVKTLFIISVIVIVLLVAGLVFVIVYNKKKQKKLSALYGVKISEAKEAEKTDLAKGAEVAESSKDFETEKKPSDEERETIKKIQQNKKMKKMKKLQTKKNNK